MRCACCAAATEPGDGVKSIEPAADVPLDCAWRGGVRSSAFEDDDACCRAASVGDARTGDTGSEVWRCDSITEVRIGAGKDAGRESDGR